METRVENWSNVVSATRRDTRSGKYRRAKYCACCDPWEVQMHFHWSIMHATVATREIRRAWNELDWAWILKHWRNCSVCDGNLQNCPSLLRRAQSLDRRTFVERYFWFPIRGKLSRWTVLYFHRSWHTLRANCISFQSTPIDNHRLSDAENGTRLPSSFFLSDRPLIQKLSSSRQTRKLFTR